MDYPNLKKAPIAEAILQIRFESSQEILNNFEEFFDVIREDFPIKKTRYSYSKSFKLEDDDVDQIIDNQESIKTLDSYVFYNEDMTRSIILHNDYYSFHFISNYTNWEQFNHLSKKYWEVVSSKYKIESIQKITLRYINKITLRLPLKIEEYFNISNMGGDSLEYDIYNFFTKYLIFSNAYNAPANIIIAKDNTIQNNEERNNNEITIVVDIDTFKELESDINIWEIFEDLRNFKNEVFFKVLTQKTRNLFE